MIHRPFFSRSTMRRPAFPTRTTATSTQKRQKNKAKQKRTCNDRPARNVPTGVVRFDVCVRVAFRRVLIGYVRYRTEPCGCTRESYLTHAGRICVRPIFFLPGRNLGDIIIFYFFSTFFCHSCGIVPMSSASRLISFVVVWTCYYYVAKKMKKTQLTC